MISVQSQQILVPKQVYIGDTAELRCSFNYSSEILQQLTVQGVTELPVSAFLLPLDSRDFQINKVTLAPAGVNYYQLTITFIPWKTGEIQFPPYEIEGINFSFEPVTIVSLTEQNSITALQDSSSPLLLPGTTYKLYVSLILVVIVLFFSIRTIIHYKQVAFFFKNQKLKRKYRKNAQSTKKKLLALLQNKVLAEKDISSEIQKILRNYLEVRFSYPFTKTVTSDLMRGFYNATLGLLSEEKEIAFESFVTAFVRTDYIRYSGQAHFEPDELNQLINELIDKIVVIETPEPEKKEEGGENV